MIYLDTHVLLWLDARKESLFPQRVRKMLETEELLISPAVYLEMEFLYEAGRITEHAETVYDSLSARIPLRFCGLPFENVARKAALLRWTRDPFDRMIVASALCSDAVLISKDREIMVNYHKTTWK